MRVRVWSILVAAAALVIVSPGLHQPAGVSAQGCDPALQNPIVCENLLAGTPASVWDITGAGDTTIQGFPTDISVNRGGTIGFKVESGGPFEVDIYRIGYYAGAGARFITSLGAFARPTQPSCLTQSATGLVDCGNWSVSATWAVPATATSGVYFAHLKRTDTGGASHALFVIRDDAGSADLLFQTSDTTWHAYNQYGGNSLYVGGPGTNPGRAYKVSYNRPITTRATSADDYFFAGEYPMVRWLEANGYNVSYVAGVDTDRLSGVLTPAKHRAFLSVGHDEYWSGAQRAKVEAARDAGLHLAFFSGNEIFWKTRWETSIDGSATPYRTLVTYKETHANAKIDPSSQWTGTWRDGRFSPPADGGRPENALSGTIFTVNSGSGTTLLSVSDQEGKLRFWRNTAMAALPAGGSASINAGILGYEWDEDLDNGFRPPGLMRLSSTTTSVGQKLQDNGSTYASGTATHSMTMYRHASGSLVFGAGTPRWSWALDNDHDNGSAAADVRARQATVNLFADMGAQPRTLQAGLSPATQSSDTLAPTSTIASPAPGFTVTPGTPIAITGSAVENGGGTVSLVEVSIDDGATWRRANGRGSWSYTWTPGSNGPVTIRSRAFDDSGNAETPSSGVSGTVSSTRPCPCSVWSSSAVPDRADGDSSAVEVGMKFRADVSGFISGVRFYKFSVNGGTHIGNLWSATGTRLATVTFTNETASGWQEARFAAPVAITANTTYVVSYHAPAGRYGVTSNFFASGVDNPPLHALRDGVSGANGVYLYSTSSAFPTQTFQSENYWVDVVFETSMAPDTTPPTVSNISPGAGATGVSVTGNITATFSEAMDAATITSSTFELRNSANALVSAVVSYDPATRTATLDPNASLALASTYTATIRGGAVDPRVKDAAGNALAASVSSSFTTTATPPPPDNCPCTIWAPTTVPDRQDSDSNAVEIGVRFRASQSGYVTGVRFYKYSANNGTHTGNLWSNTGTRLATVTFTGESASGWQEAQFATPVPVTANTTYVASYHAPVGRYGVSSNYFTAAGVTRGPLTALRDGLDGANGVYRYTTSSVFPTSTFQSENYFVDVVFVTSLGNDSTPPAVSSITPAAGQTGVSANATVDVVFSEAMDPATIATDTIELRDASNLLVPASVAYQSASRLAVLTPAQPLAYSTGYSVLVKGGATDPRVKDVGGNAMTANVTSAFTVGPPPPPPPDQGPGGPILVLASSTNPFGRYTAEMLRAEGLNAFAVADISTMTAAALGSYDVVILGQMALTPAQVTMLTSYINGGGNLIAFRPDKQLASLIGLTDAGGTITNGYLQINTANSPGSGLVGQTMQFHGSADRYTAFAGTTVVATLYSNATTATSLPAVTVRDFGESGGQVAAFTFDLARSILNTRQGNPAWSGQNRDGAAPIRSNDLFFGAAAGDAQPDWVDLNKIGIPQADEQQRLLGKLVEFVTRRRKPLPRFWFLPRGLKAAVVMTGDDHGTNGTAPRFEAYKDYSLPGCSVADWECVRSTSYIYPTTPISNALAASYVSQGFEVALHVTTNCLDYTASTLPGIYADQIANFRSVFPGVPAPATNRTHCVTWSDYNTQPEVAAANGVRLDTNYYHFPASWIGNRIGFMTGSGMPMRFARSTGEIVDVYQLATHMTDESGQSFPAVIDTLLDRALGPEGYYGVFTANMHTDLTSSTLGSDFIVQSAIARGVPVVSARQMLTWLDGRNSSSFRSIVYSGNILLFDITVGAGANGLRAMLPTTTQSGALTGIQRDGVAITYTRETIKGVEYAFFPAVAGSYRASYGIDATPPAITNVGASAVTGASAAVTWSTSEASDSQVTYGVSPSALTSTVSDPSLVTSHVATLTGLTGGTTYYYRVRSADAAGNAAVSPVGTPASFTMPQPAITIGDASATEGGSVTFPVSLSGPSAATVTVQYATANATASAGSDYTSATSTLTFAPGTQTQSIVVSGLGDTLDEPNETFTVNLSAPANATIARAQAVGTIADDDGPPSISIADATVVEGNAGVANASFAVTLSQASGQTITVSYASSNGAAVAGSDFTTASGTLTFAPGVTTQTIQVAVTGDALNEADESFAVTLSNPTNATLARAAASGTISNDDLPPSISIADIVVQEGNAGTTAAVFTISLSAASGQAVSVGYSTSPGTAAAGADYQTVSGTATIAAGATSTTVTVPVVGDTALEPDETFLLNLAGPVNATIARAQASAVIVNDEGLPTLSIADVALAEGNSGTSNAVFTVTMSGPGLQETRVAWTTADGTAAAGTDYVAGSGTLVIAAGATSGTITVAVTGDAATESAETFTVNLSNPVNAAIARAQATATINNDDGTPGLVAAYNFNETSGATVIDSSGNNLTGTISGATRTAAGHAGQALTFDGVNDWVTVNDTAVLDVTRVTIEAWVRPTTLNGWRSVVLKESASGLAYALYAYDNAPRPAAYVNVGGIDREVQGTAAPVLNGWTHLAVTYDGTTERLYMNGTQVGTRAVAGNIAVSNLPLRIGGNAPWGEFFAGQIDDVRIYNRALTAAEIATDMATPVP